jgi:hypothetical protein
MSADAFHLVSAPPVMRSLWKMSFYCSVSCSLQPRAAQRFILRRCNQVFDSQRPFITLHELCSRTWKFRFKQAPAPKSPSRFSHLTLRG